MLHTKSGISFDFICENRGGARDYILKDLLKGVSTEDLIRGEVFVKTYTYLNKEGDISQVEIESLQTDELIPEMTLTAVSWMNFRPFMSVKEVLQR